MSREDGVGIKAVVFMLVAMVVGALWCRLISIWDGSGEHAFVLVVLVLMTVITLAIQYGLGAIAGRGIK